MKGAGSSRSTPVTSVRPISKISGSSCIRARLPVKVGCAAAADSPGEVDRPWLLSMIRVSGCVRRVDRGRRRSADEWRWWPISASAQSPPIAPLPPRSGGEGTGGGRCRRDSDYRWPRLGKTHAHSLGEARASPRTSPTRTLPAATSSRGEGDTSGGPYCRSAARFRRGTGPLRDKESAPIAPLPPRSGGEGTGGGRCRHDSAYRWPRLGATHAQSAAARASSRTPPTRTLPTAPSSRGEGGASAGPYCRSAARFRRGAGPLRDKESAPIAPLPREAAGRVRVGGAAATIALIVGRAPARRMRSRRPLAPHLERPPPVPSPPLLRRGGRGAPALARCATAARIVSTTPSRFSATS